MDLTVFRWINNQSMKNQFFDQIAIFLSSYGIILMIISILSLILVKKKRVLALYGLIALVVALGINRIFKIVIDRPRPFMEHTVNLVIERSPSPSFPSDQALIAGVFLVFIWFVAKKFFSFALIYSLSVILSRVYVGHHYPSDVFVGCLVGAVLTVAVFFVAKSLHKNQETRRLLEKSL